MIIDNCDFKVNPYNLPFMTGFGGSLAEIFNKTNDDIIVSKQILLISSHYTTYSKIIHKDESFWTFWNDKLIFYDKSEIEDTDYIYYKNDKEIGRSAFLCESKYYTGSKGGIFANDDSIKLHFIPNDGELKKYIDWIEINDKYYYLCRYYSTYKDSQFNYVLKHLNK